VGVCGSEQALFALLKGLDRERYKPIVAVPSQGPLKQRLSEIGIKTAICPAMIWMPLKQMPFFLFILKYYIFLPWRIIKIADLMRREKVDLVFSNELLLLEGGIAARLMRLPHIYHVHNAFFSTYFRTYLPVGFIKWLTLKLADRMIFVSQRQMEELFDNPLIESRFRVATQGFDAQYFLPDKERDLTWRRKTGISENSPLVVLIAASASNKGQEDFLQAASIVKEAMPAAQFAIIGGGDKSYLKKLKDLALGLGLRDDVFFVDFMEDIAPVYGSLDVLVCASLKETFGRTIVEAMLAEKPVVSTRCGGPEEIVIDGVTGLLVSVNAPQELAGAILMILRDRDLAQKMGQEGKKRAESCYSMQSYARDIQDIIEECFSELRIKRPIH